MNFRPIVAAALLLISAACTTAGSPRIAADRAMIEAAGREFSAAYMRGDIERMMSLYTADAVIFPNNSEMLAGHQALRRYWTLAPDHRVTHHKATATEIRIDGDHAYDYGVFEIAGVRRGESYGPARGKYVIVWKRGADGTWRMHLDIWNNRPQAK